MNVFEHKGFKIGEPVDVIDSHSDGELLTSGTITALGSKSTSVIDDVGNEFDVPYGMLKSATVKTAQNNVLKQEEKDGKQFVLEKHEDNLDGKLSVIYTITVDGQKTWESEEVITNVYDVEEGWSPPDDFDDNKLELIQNTAEAGFELLVESYQNIEEQIKEGVPADGTEEGAEDTAADVPAFAPGEGPSNGGGGGGAGGGGEPLAEEDVVDEVGDEEAEVPEGEAPPAEAPAEETATASYSRKITSKKKEGDDRLHRNPQHRLNPLLRAEMDRRGIDSGTTHDIELSEKLKDFDYGGAPPKKSSIDRIRAKMSSLNTIELD